MAMERTSQFVGESGAFLDSVERASRAAALNRPVLVIGERGTGKELVAERLHRLSPRWDGPFVTMNCAALTETLIEAELFGHEAGAFTGATKTREGRFEEADGGTLFLDELATLSAAAQERLLRAVEYGEVTRIGSNRPIRVDVRIVAATNEHLPALVDKGRFRADLLDRLAFEVVTLPPLRARDGDIEVLADHFGRRMASEMEWPSWPGFSKQAVAQLKSYDWPGNVRELRNVADRFVLGVLGRTFNGGTGLADVVPLADQVDDLELEKAGADREGFVGAGSSLRRGCRAAWRCGAAQHYRLVVVGVGHVKTLNARNKRQAMGE
mgnify:CR=1 FL=1